MQWIFVIVLRLLAPLTILRWPLFGSVVAIVADNIDVIILDYLGVTDYSPYNRVDKFLDTYFYLIQGYTVLYWKNKFTKKVALFLLGYRLLGVVIYELTELRYLLFVFPNLFIFFFLYVLIYKKLFKREPFNSLKKALPALLVMLVIKLIQEYLLHVSQFPFYQTLKNFFT